MGLSSLPAPSEGMLCVLLVNTALSISVFKAQIRSILDLIGLHHLFLRNSVSPGSSDYNQPQNQASKYDMGPPESYMNLFQSQMRTLCFDVLCCCRDEAPDACRREHDCSVCLSEFVPESEISMLSCNHVFHRTCLEKWLVYWNITCPLCRSPFLPEEEEEGGFSCYRPSTGPPMLSFVSNNQDDHVSDCRVVQ